MKKLVLFVVVMCVQFAAVAQIVGGRWGSTDIRYPMGFETPVSVSSVNSAVAWRGERVNFQLLVWNQALTNKAYDCSVEYKFSDLKCGKSIISAANVVGGFVQPVITDKFTGCGRHEVPLRGAYRGQGCPAVLSPAPDSPGPRRQPQP